MKYTITVLTVPGYPLTKSQFDKLFDEHVRENDKDKEIVQMWHSHTSRTASQDYYHILWKLR